MKLWQKLIFIAVLVFFVAASVTISLISVSRPAYKYDESSVTGDDGSPIGREFSSFNGNAGTKELNIDFVRDGDGLNPDESLPVISIGAFAVNADEYAEEIFIGAAVETIDDYAFYNAKSLKRVSVDPANEFFKDVNGILFSKDGKRLLLYPAHYGQKPTDDPDEFTYPETYDVPDGVERIGSFAFLKNDHLRDVRLPESLREVGDMAFFGCSRLGSYDYDAETDSLEGAGFELPDGIESIGADAFSKCTGIAPCIFIPESVKVIKSHAFFADTGMKEFLIGAVDDSGMKLGTVWLPKSIKAGALWREVSPRYGASRADADELIKAFRAERLEAMREEAKSNG